jgi:PIN domain nuclease of toxin-antitoxin system
VTYLLDTHAWVWMNSFPELLSPASRNALQELGGDDELLLSPISVWEVCKLVEKGRITLFQDLETWVSAALDAPGLRLAALDVPVFLKSTTLPPPFHHDPADQMIVATARLRDATIITRDRLIRDYPYVKTLW